MSSVKIIPLPYWAAATLSRNNLELNKILDLSTVRKYFSRNDIVAMSILNEYCNKLTKRCRDASFCTSIFYEWSVSATPEDKSFLHNQLTPFFQDQGIRDGIEERLFKPFAGNPDNQSKYFELGQNATVWTDNPELPYSLVHLQSKTIGLLLKPNGFTSETIKIYGDKLISDIVRQLYVYEQPSEVAKSPLMLWYLESLSEQ